MTSVIYLYSKFTEELLLLSAAAFFTLLSSYCYQWVIKKRRLGAARNEIPAAVVKVYLNQLIHEAQFVRTQLFGLANNLPEGSGVDPAELLSRLAQNTPSAAGSSAGSALDGIIPSDLEDRLKSMQSKLAEKESIVVNINVEKSKLLEEIENLRHNQKAMQNASSSAPDDLLKKVKELEARLEEYSLFEDDLANLKRLQQENIQLKKRLEGIGGSLSATPAAQAQAPAPAPTLTAVPDPAPASARPAPSESLSFREPQAPVPAPASIAPSGKDANQDAIDALLNGLPATPPVQTESELRNAPKDEFENLVTSVESSIAAEAKAEPSVALAPAPAAPGAPTTVSMSPPPPESIPAMPGPAPVSQEPLSAKSDEELLKEFENLLNS
jgi:hypothetical protein